MKQQLIERTIRSWMTSAFGLALLIFAGIYFYQNLKDLSLETILIGLALGAGGFVFLFVKDSLITGLFSRNTGVEHKHKSGETPTEPGTPKTKPVKQQY